MNRGISSRVPRVPGKGFVVIDTETTGLHDPARIIEIAMVFVSPSGKVEDSWTTLVKGDGSAGGRRLEQIHGIRDHDLVKAPTFGQIATEVLGAMQGRVVFAHNAKFDRARINYELRLLRRSLLPELGCTMYLGQRLGHGLLKLDEAIDAFAIRRATAHCAHDDALATAHLLGVYMRNHPQGFRSYLSHKGFG